MSGRKLCRWKPRRRCSGNYSQTKNKLETQRNRVNGGSRNLALISPATDSNLILIPNSVFLYFLLTSVFQRCWFIWDGRRVTLRPTTSHGFLAAVKIAFAPALSRAAQIDVQRVPAVVVAL